MPFTNADMMSEVQEQAIDRLMELAPLIIASATGPDGALMDGVLTRDQRIQRFLDDAQSGAIDAMAEMDKALHTNRAQQAVRQYFEDMKAVTEAGNRVL